MMTRMRAERRRRYWSASYVGDQLGITRTAVFYLETKQRKPSYDILMGLEDLFELPGRELFELVEDVPDTTSKKEGGEI